MYIHIYLYIYICIRIYTHIYIYIYRRQAGGMRVKNVAERAISL